MTYDERHRGKLYEFGGERLTLPQWSKRTGIRYDLLKNRLKHGWSLERTLTQLPRQGRLSDYDYSMSHHCRGCYFARRLSSGVKYPVYCNYLGLMGERRPVPAAECRGYSSRTIQRPEYPGREKGATK